MIYRGNAVSRGIVTGKVFVFKKEQVVLDRRNVDQFATDEELRRLDFALIQTGEEIAAIISLLEKNAQEAKIFKAHADMLRDVEMLKMIH
jgi:phosphotransferase system enzyme I (PtsI)